MKETLSERLAAQVARSLTARLHRDVAFAPVTDAVDWWSAYEIATPSRRLLVVGVGRNAASRLAQALGAADGGDAVVIDTVLDLLKEVVQVLGRQPENPKNLTVRVLDEARQPASGVQTYWIAAGDEVLCELGCWEVPSAAGDMPPLLENLGVILDIELPLTVRFGESEMTLQSICALGPGSVVDLGRTPDEPVDVLVNGRLVARGEVIVVSGNYGVRVTEVLSTAERIHTMGR